MAEHLYTSRYTPRRVARRRRRWVAALVTLALLAGLLVAFDRVAARAAESEMRNQVAAGLLRFGVTYGSMEVALHGYPFLNQVTQGRYEQITIDLTDVQVPVATALDPAGSAGAEPSALRVHLPRLNLVATGVVADAWDLLRHTPTAVTASSVSGTAIISYEALQALTDLSPYGLHDVTYTPTAEGTVNLAAVARVFGLELSVTGVGAVLAVDGRIELRLSDLKAGAMPVPDLVEDVLGNLAEDAIRAKIPVLPYGLSLDTVRPEPAGLLVTVSGRDVTLVT